MSDETRQLAKFTVGLGYEDIPEKVRVQGINLLIDQIGVQIGCSDMPWAKQIRETYCSPGGKPEATVVRYGDQLPLVAAAFINSTFGHSFEYDDANRLAHGHLGAELIPALVAVGERQRISGKQFLTTMIAAYEVRGRLGWALAPDLNLRGGPQYSSTCGPFGVAAGVGRLMGMDAEGVRNAMAIAGCFSGGLAQYDHGGGSAKRIFTAIATSNGLQAAQMAQAGITGPEEILEGVHGLLKIYSNTFKPHVLVADLGTKWVLEHAAFKAYCCCAGIHSAIDGIRRITSTHGLKAGDIQSIEVGYPKPSADHAAITDPQDLLGMQFSTSFSLALTILKGRNSPLEYTESAMKDPEVRDLASKISVKADDSLEQYYENHRPARVVLKTTAGTNLEEFVLDAKGSSTVPMTLDDVEEKFSMQVRPVLGRAAADKLLDTLRGIDKLDDLSRLPKMMIMQNETAAA